MKITVTKKGKYSTVVYLGRDPSGKPITKRITADSKAKLTASVSDILSNARIFMSSHLFRDALERYIAAREPFRSVSTIRGYKSIQKALSSKFDAFCSKSVASVTSADVQNLIDKLVTESYSSKTIRNWVGLINSVLIESGCTPVNVMFPKAPVIYRPIYSEGEIKMILCLLHGDPLEVPFQLATLGLRRGEICALELSDLSEDDIIHVHKSRVPIYGGGTKVNLSAKTDTSNRFVQLPHHLAEIIRRHGRVCPYSPNGLNTALRKFLRKYKFPPYRLHDCRHFFASYCHAHGVPEADILAGGGWKTASVMRSVYRHSMAKNRAGAAVSSLLGNR